MGSHLMDREKKKEEAVENTVKKLKGKTNNKHRIEIVVDDEMMEKLQKQAKELGVPKATYIKLLIAKDLNENKKGMQI